MVNVIIPMAGQGSRMRPHTLTTPKPWISIAGKPIIAHLVENIGALCRGLVGTIGFVVHKLTETTKIQLCAMAQTIGAKAQFYEQPIALGTAHAIFLAQDLLQDRVIIAFSDTLFKSNTPLDPTQGNIIWVKKVTNPSAFGVVKVAPNQLVTDFVEKPTSFSTDLAIIGLYYFREGHILQKAIQQLIAQNTMQGEEYQLTTALSAMQQQGARFTIQEISEWLDCGNQKATLHAHKRLLTLLSNRQELVAHTAHVDHSIIIPPVYLGESAIIKNTVLGPYVSVGGNTSIDNARIQNSMIQEHSVVSNMHLTDSMLGNYVHLAGESAKIDLGDYNTLKI